MVNQNLLERFFAVCKVFNQNAIETQFINGFDDWKNAGNRIGSYEMSHDHIASLSAEKSQRYWVEVLRRAVSVKKSF